MPVQAVEAPGEEEAEGSAGVGGGERSKEKTRIGNLLL